MDSAKKPKWRTPPWVEGHIAKYLSDPEGAVLWDASQAGAQGQLTTLLLTTKGRRSGEPRHAPLIYQEVDGGYVVIASKGGFPEHPVWYLNLLADPVAEVRVGAKRFKARARTVTGDERARIWKRMAQAYPPYDDYQARAKDREIPVVVLEPVG